MNYECKGNGLEDSREKRVDEWGKSWRKIATWQASHHTESGMRMKDGADCTARQPKRPKND